MVRAGASVGRLRVSRREPDRLAGSPEGGHQTKTGEQTGEQKRAFPDEIAAPPSVEARLFNLPRPLKVP